MSWLSQLFGSSKAEVEAARAAQTRVQDESARFLLEQQHRWMQINAMIKEGWRPCNTQSYEYMQAIQSNPYLAIGQYQGLYAQIEMCRIGEKETWVTRWDDIPSQMNVVDLWWRPVQITDEYQRPIEGGELKAEEPLALPAPTDEKT